MLAAKLIADRINAAIAVRGPEYHCPNCNGIVILKIGRKVIAHFAHKPPTTCPWKIGETRAHLEAKSLVEQALSGRGLKAEVEFVVNTLHGDRRADVMAWSPKGLPIAFELQHTPIDLNEIEARAFSYSQADIAQVWIPFLKASVWKEGKAQAGGWFVEKYSPRPFERWIHGFYGKHGMWMYDPTEKEFWLGRMEPHHIYVNPTTWFSEGGEENSGGGFYRLSKRYKELTLKGPYKAEILLVKIEPRHAFATKEFSWPEGRIALLVPAKCRAGKR